MTRVVQPEPEKIELLEDLLGFEGTVFSFAGGPIESWIETSINDSEPTIHPALSLYEPNLNVKSAEKLAGTVVLQWERETGGAAGTRLHLRLNAGFEGDVAVHREASFFIPGNLSGTGDRPTESAGADESGPMSANDVPSGKELRLLRTTFFPPETSVSEASSVPWDPMNGQKLTVTLKARFVNLEDTREPPK